MKLELHKNSLFAILLRTRWWVSLAIAAALFSGLRAFLSDALAAFAALPFAVISGVALWKQLRMPSAGRVAATLERHRAMAWEDFAGTLEQAYRRKGYRVTRLDGTQADLELALDGQLTLVACKRWKAVRTGIEPLRELQAAAHACKAQGCLYLAAGEVTDNARTFAAQNNIRLLQDVELARLLQG